MKKMVMMGLVVVCASISHDICAGKKRKPQESEQLKTLLAQQAAARQQRYGTAFPKGMEKKDKKKKQNIANQALPMKEDGVDDQQKGATLQDACTTQALSSSLDVAQLSPGKSPVSSGPGSDWVADGYDGSRSSPEAEQGTKLLPPDQSGATVQPGFGFLSIVASKLGNVLPKK